MFLTLPWALSAFFIGSVGSAHSLQASGPQVLLQPPLASHFTLSPYDFSSHDLKDDPGAQDSQVCISSQTSPDPSSLCPTSPSPWISQQHTKAGTPQNKWSFPPPLLFSDPDGVSGASAHPTAQQEPEERLLILFSPFTSNL